MIKRSALNMFVYSVKMILSGCIVFIFTACTSSPATTSIPDPTNTPVPTEDSPQKISLYRGNPQRTGSFDFPAIRDEPSINWQTKLSSTWLMPPILAGEVLYTGSGNGTLYAVDVQNR